MVSEKKYEELEKREQRPLTLEKAEGLAREGERIEGRGFVKTEGFDKTIAFVMSLTQTIWQITQKHKSFRMELFYDAETLNTNYYLFTPVTDKCESNDIQQE